MAKLFIGQIIHCKSLDDLEFFTNGFVAVDNNGKIIGVGPDSSSWIPEDEIYEEILLTPSQFLMPGFIDCHIHASQMPNIGLGLDKPLLEWLESYTFPLEAAYNDVEFAQRIYKQVVETTLKCGTTLACYFATNYKESSVILAKEAVEQGQRAFVGKVSSDCNSPSFYIEKHEDSIRDNIEFIKKVKELNSRLVQPIITPRFAVTCTKELMTDLGALASEFDLNIQSHLSENPSEIEFVEKTFGKSYSAVYKEFGLLTKKCIMAHGVHLQDEELNILRDSGTSIAHCPVSNTFISSGLCDVKRLLNAGIKVGLGTDVSGGNRASIQDVILNALDVSMHIFFLKTQDIKGTGKMPNTSSDYKPLNYKQAIYLATLGGAEALSVDHLIGNFQIGKEFDAIVVETEAFPIDTFDLPESLTKNKTREDLLIEIVQKFIYVGNYRNIVKVFVQGKQVK